MTADGVVGPATWSALGIRGRHPVLKRTALRSSARTRSGMPIRVRRAIAAANRIARAPYVYGGGHRSFRSNGYDCSGSISYVLRGAGALRSPLDSRAFASYGRPGKGRWITIYTNPGHAFMVINGRRYDTSAGNGTRWATSMRSTAGYTVRHPPGL
jgi:cell wall-associated NlpC family hydrolase